MRKLLSAKAILNSLIAFCLLGLTSLGLWQVGAYFGAEYHLRQAQQALTRQRYPHALEELSAALRFRPRSAELQLLAGRTARQSGSLSVAEEHLQKCRSLQKGVSEELQLEEYLLRAQKGEVETVYSFLAPYLFHEGPETPLVLEALSHAYIFIYRLDLAWKCLTRWLELEPENVEAINLRGIYYTMKTDNNSAIADLRRALELDPERLAARILLAQTLKLSNHTPEAVKEFELALQQNPNSFAGRVGLASCYVDIGQVQEARSCMEQLPSEMWNHPEALYVRGRITEGEGRLDEAIPLFRETLAANPSDSLACYRLSLCYQRKGDEESASKYQERFSQIEKDQKRLIALTNDLKDALPTNPALCCELGEVCLRLGIKDRGVYWLNMALRIDQNYWPAHEQLFHFYESLGPQGEKEASFHRQRLASRPTGR
jgi:tetratricopeptide (TPR) repeat protein